MTWQWDITFDGSVRTYYCPLCKKIRKLVKISWMHHWLRCCYCLLKLPLSNRNRKVLEA